MEVQELKTQLSSELLSQEHVTGVGIGEDSDGNSVVVINVEKGKASAVSIPQQYSGENIEVRETGSFNAEIVKHEEPEAIDRKGKHRPVPAGVSAGHVNVTAGTAGFIVEDNNGNQYPTSNNHVYANVNKASEGDTIIQPGSVDGGTTSDKSGELAGYVPIEDGTVLDFAWITSVVEHTLELAEVGKPQGDPTTVSVGDTLIKSGRTTGVTEAQVDQTSANVNVNYGDATYQINDCIITGDMSNGGDSGSAVLKKDTMQPAGILFAGSDTATVHNKATNVKPETGLSIVTASGDTTPTANVTITLTKQSAETGDMVVQVQDGSGQGVGSANVSISGPVTDSGSTDTNGSITFTGIDIGSYTVEATKDGYDGGTATVDSTDFN